MITGLEIKLSSITNILEEKYESMLKLKDEQMESLKKDRAKYVGRCGGYQKSQNDYQKKIALLNENLKVANEKINNLRKRLKEDFVPVSPMQYDNKITTVAQHKKNLAKGK